MGPIIITTKLSIPAQPPRPVLRPHLQAALDYAATHYKLTLISAPAGYGKTTLLAEWARASQLPVAWLSITGEEQDLERFLRYLFAAWEIVEPEVARTPLGMLLESSEPDLTAVQSAFLNTASQIRDPLVFVLDDFHLIQNNEVLEAVGFLLDHLPPNVHFTLAGRSEPPLSLARYRAHQRLLEIRTDDLRCNREESAAFLNRSMRLGLSEERLDLLHQQTEGWIAGLQLAGLMLRKHPEATESAPFASGGHRFIADYLKEDVFAHLPVDLRAFLLKTSLLDRLSAPLCEAITGVKESQSVLERIERENLFLVPLDAKREWFRYHTLFAEFLSLELLKQSPEEIPELHRQAAHWFLNHDFHEEALRHAIACQDAGLVVQIGEQYFEPKLLSGETRVVARWLDSLPEHWEAEYPQLSLARVAVLLFTGAVEDSARYVDQVEQRLAREANEETRLTLARVDAVRCTIACFQNDMARAESYANRALQELPEEDHAFRAIIYHALGDTYRRNGLWEQARFSYLKVLELRHAPAFPLRSVHVYGALADLALHQGRLRESAGLWRKALTIIEEREFRGSFPLPLIGWVYIRMGEILYEWNELEKAAVHLSKGLERSELGSDAQALIAGDLLEGRLKLTSGDLVAAGERLDHARPLLERAAFADWRDRFGRLQLEVWLAHNQLKLAADWANAMLQDDRIEGIVAQLAVMRALVSHGNPTSLKRSKSSLERLVELAQREGRTGIQIETLALYALADWQRGERPSAMIQLERALRLAEPEGYVRLFADLGLPMARLLQEAQARGIMSEYVQILLDAFRGNILAPVESALPEPLTRREQTILELIAAGLTNDEIAERLVLSPETVKKHTGNIYGKLGVHSRTQAVARAREWKMLS